MHRSNTATRLAAVPDDPFASSLERIGAALAVIERNDPVVADVGNATDYVANLLEERADKLVAQAFVLTTFGEGEIDRLAQIPRASIPGAVLAQWEEFSEENPGLGRASRVLPAVAKFLREDA